MRTETINLYKYNELSDVAKENARNWWLEGGLDYEWYDCTIDDCKTALEMVGFSNVKIHFSGFSSQGDGACFMGNYEYKKGALNSVKKEFPQLEALHQLTEQLQLINRRYFYQLAFKLVKTGHMYSHQNMVTVDYVERLDGCEIKEDNLFDDLIDVCRDFMCEIYNMLEREYDYLTSTESVEDSILANEYEFTADGSIH